MGALHIENTGHGIAGQQSSYSLSRTHHFLHIGALVCAQNEGVAESGRVVNSAEGDSVGQLASLAQTCDLRIAVLAETAAGIRVQTALHVGGVEVAVADWELYGNGQLVLIIGATLC